jgi:hypothetical protein
MDIAPLAEFFAFSDCEGRGRPGLRKCKSFVDLRITVADRSGTVNA